MAAWPFVTLEVQSGHSEQITRQVGIAAEGVSVLGQLAALVVQQDRLPRRIAARVDGDEAAFLGVVGRREEVQVAVREARGFQPRCHAFGGERAAAGRQGRVGLDQFLVERAEALFAGGSVLRGRGER